MTGSFKVEYLQVAVKDLMDIHDYIREDDPSSADSFLDRIDKAIGELGKFPYLGTVPKDDRLKLSGYRILPIDNYLVFYKIIGDVVEIRRIIHGSRRYSFLL